MKKRATLSLAFMISTVSPAATSAPIDAFDSHVRSGATEMFEATPARPLALQSGVFPQLVDHAGLLPGQTFGQRYWYDSEFAVGAAAPVLYHVCGETDVDGSYFLTDNVLEWAKALGAHVVWLEHRYYGQSQPFADLTTPHLRYLTLNNVLEDLAGFQGWIATNQGWTGKWIALGGSYSATLAALYRQKHPELVVGALAASAPMISGVGSAIGSSGDAGGLSSTVITPGASERQWAYQSCTEVGYWLAESGDRGAPLDLPSRALCGQVFANTPYFDAAAYNRAFDAPFLAPGVGAPSNILFTEGSEDVWTDIGLAVQTNHSPAITILTIDGGGHHYDLNAARRGDSQAVQDARATFTTLAAKWLNDAL